MNDGYVMDSCKTTFSQKIKFHKPDLTFSTGQNKY